jgi:MFS family permease
MPASVFHPDKIPSSLQANHPAVGARRRLRELSRIMTNPAVSPFRLAMGGFLCLAAAMGIGRFVLTPILPYMAETIPLTAAQGGFVASANFLGYLLGALGATAFPRRHLQAGFAVGLAGSVLTTGMMALDDGVVFLAAIRFLGGLASAGVLVFSSTFVLENLAAGGNAKLGDVHFAGVGIGIAFSAVVVGGLAHGGGNWRGLWEGSGLLSLALCCGAWVCLAPGMRAEAEAARAPVPVGADAGTKRRSPARIPPALMRIALAYGLFGIGYVVTATFLTSILRASESLAPFEAPAWAAVGLSAAISVWVWGRIAARIGLGRGFALACVLEAIGIAASVLVPGVAGLAIAAILFGGTFMGITSLGLVEARRLSTGDPRRLLGVMTACFGVGQMVGPTLAGLIADATGSFYWPSLGAAAVLLLAALLVGPFAERA